MTEELSYYHIPDPPDTVSGASVLARAVDGLGFRFRWATEGLRESDYTFRPDEQCMSIREQTEHIWGLVNWIILSLTGDGKDRPDTFALIRKSVLEMIVDLRELLLSMSDNELKNARIHDHSFWHFINGPVADALTHVGQINVLRRLAGNPTPDVNVFTGKPNL